MSVNILGSLGDGLSSGLSGLVSGGITGLAGGLISSIFGGNSAKKQYKYASKLQQQQNDWQSEQNLLASQRSLQNSMDLFDYQNEYNTPANQVERLRQAGINPMLAFSNGSISNVGSLSPTTAPNGSSGAPSVGMPSFDMSSVGQSGAALQNAQTNSLVGEQQARAQKVDTDIRQANSQLEILYKAKKLGVDTDTYESMVTKSLQSLGWDISNKALDVTFKSNSMGSRLDQAAGDALKASADAQFTALQTRLQSFNLPYAAEVALNGYLSSCQQLYNLYLTGRLTKAQVNEVFSRISLNSALGNYYNSSAALNRSMKKFYDGPYSNYYNSAAFNQNQQGYLNMMNQEFTGHKSDLLKLNIYDLKTQLGFKYGKNPFIGKDGQINWHGIAGTVKFIRDTGFEAYRLGTFQGIGASSISDNGYSAPSSPYGSPSSTY